MFANGSGSRRHAGGLSQVERYGAIVLEVADCPAVTRWGRGAASKTRQ